MKISFFYSAGLILTIMGLIGIIDETGPAWSRYVVLALGFFLLLITYKTSPKLKNMFVIREGIVEYQFPI